MTSTAPPLAPPDPAMLRLGRFTHRRRRPVLLAALLVFLAAAFIGSGTMNALVLSRFEAPGSESIVAGDELERRFDVGSANFLLLVTAADGDVDSAASAEAGAAVAAELAAMDNIGRVDAYWDAASPTLRSEDGSQALITAHVPGDVTTVREEILPGLKDAFTRDDGAVTVAVGGSDELFREVAQLAREDFLLAEAIVIPGLLVLLILLYRRPVAALLTVGTGLFALAVSLAAIRFVASPRSPASRRSPRTSHWSWDWRSAWTTACSSSAGSARASAEVTRRAGGGRHRQHGGPHGPVQRPHGRHVAVALLLFPLSFLRSFGYAGAFVVPAPWSAPWSSCLRHWALSGTARCRAGPARPSRPSAAVVPGRDRGDAAPGGGRRADAARRPDGGLARARGALRRARRADPGPEVGRAGSITDQVPPASRRRRPTRSRSSSPRTPETPTSQRTPPPCPKWTVSRRSTPRRPFVDGSAVAPGDPTGSPRPAARTSRPSRRHRPTGDPSDLVATCAPCAAPFDVAVGGIRLSGRLPRRDDRTVAAGPRASSSW